MKRKLLLFLLPLACCCGQVRAQLTPERCYELARANYPLLRQQSLVERTEAFNLDNASKQWLPRLTLSGKASYQSDATEIPVHLPGIDIEGLSKDQYQLMLEAQQNLWDGGAVRSQKQLAKAEADVERQQVEVNLYALRGRVNQLFFAILLQTAQLEENSLLSAQLHRNYRQVEAWKASGVANDADLDAVSVELVQARQDSVQISENREAYCRVLALLIGREAVSPSELVKPSAGQLAGTENRRPELSAYDLRSRQIDARLDALKANRRPQLGLFLQMAYGKPGLNMLENKFSPYAVGGIRLSWNISSFYTLKNDRNLLETSRASIETERETFLLNTRMETTQADIEARKWQKLMSDDEEVVRLRGNIRSSAEAKAANGTMTVTDMLREVTAEARARQTKVLHEIRYLTALYDRKYITNQP